MAINRPDSFQSLGTAIVNGGETQQITSVAGLQGILTTETGSEVVISQPGLSRPNSTVLSQRDLGSNAGAFGKDSILFKNWPYGTQSALAQGEICYWDATNGVWVQASSSSFNATLLLGMAVETTGQRVIKRGFVRTNRDFSTFAIGQPLYLGINGQVIGVKPTSVNNYVRMVGFAMDTDSTAGLMFFTPDVNFETVA